MTTNEDRTLNEEVGKLVKTKKPYGQPCLKQYGSLRNLTLGGSPGTGESGSGGTRKPRTP